MRRSAPLLLALAVAIGLSWWMSRRGPAPTHEGSDPYERVVLFGPNLTEAAVALGYEDRIVAITDYCRWPESILDRPRVGGAIDPDLERLAVLDIDLLVLQGKSAVLRSFAVREGIEVLDVKMDDDVESILRGIEVIDRALAGESAPDPNRSSLVDSLRQGLSAIQGSNGDDVRSRPRVLLVVSRDPDSVQRVLTAGRGTFVDELIEIAGGESWARSRGQGYFDVALEDLVTDPPDLVVEIARAGTSDDLASMSEPWIRLFEERAPRVELMEFDGFLIPGPRILTSAHELAELIARPRSRGRER